LQFILFFFFSNLASQKLGFQKELSRIKKSPHPEIDILFYGSLNERRQKILTQLEARGLKVKSVVGLYGNERDQLIARSKVVLNHHFYTSEIFEIVRVFYLLSNAVPVVGEVNPTTSIDETYKNAIYAAPYDGIVEACEILILNDSLREATAAHGYKVISKLPQSIFTSSII
jgi:glycosyltransferase involved in cell wall biosynthesis